MQAPSPAEPAVPLMLGPAQPKALSLLHGWLPDHSTDLPVGGKSQFLKQLESHSWQSHVHRQTHARIQGTNFFFFFPSLCARDLWCETS